jgi:hypothetical protein
MSNNCKPRRYYLTERTSGCIIICEKCSVRPSREGVIHPHWTHGTLLCGLHGRENVCGVTLDKVEIGIVNTGVDVWTVSHQTTYSEWYNRPLE